LKEQIERDGTNITKSWFYDYGGQAWDDVASHQVWGSR